MTSPSPSNTPALLWFRLDLRLNDNAALVAAASRHEVIPVYIYSEDEEHSAAPGAASKWWLHHSLVALAASIEERGGKFIVRRGNAGEVIDHLLRETKACGVYWNRRYEPAIVKRDQAIKESLKAKGQIAESSNSALLFEPWQVATAAGKPYTVFTPFWRNCLSQGPPAPPVGIPKTLRFPGKWPHTDTIESLGLLPKLSWADGFPKAFTPCEAGARKRLKEFTLNALGSYADDRNRPDIEGISRLSPHLHFGEMSPNAAYFAAERALQSEHVAPAQAQSFQRELGWREFAHHLLFYFPHTVSQPLNVGFANFPWAQDRGALRSWQKGETGYPIVDAGMRELWHTGFMHNRVRMIVASFLIKHLLLSWQEGAAWFWDTLVDADLASNTLGWQWTAGCGADAAPFFRIFNPILQAQKFDPEGKYIRQWVPELANLPTKFLADPSQADPSVLAAAGITLGKTYPRRIVEHSFARQRALEALAHLKMANRGQAIDPHMNHA